MEENDKGVNNEKGEEHTHIERYTRYDRLTKEIDKGTGKFAPFYNGQHVPGQHSRGRGNGDQNG